jgi:hypothetical protein
MAHNNHSTRDPYRLYDGPTVLDYADNYKKRRQTKEAEELFKSFGNRPLTRQDYMQIQSLSPEYLKTVLSNENAIRTATAPRALGKRAELELKHEYALKAQKIAKGIADDKVKKTADATNDSWNVPPSELGMSISEELTAPEEEGFIDSILSLIGISDEDKKSIPLSEVSLQDMVGHVVAEARKEGLSLSQSNKRVDIFMKEYNSRRKSWANKRAVAGRTSSASPSAVSNNRNVPASNLFPDMNQPDLLPSRR